MTEIHDNLTPTKRMLERLEADPYFRVEDLNDLDAQIPVIFWILCVRAPNAAGKMEITKGPHYQKNVLRVRGAMDSSGARFFRIAGRVICARFSEDLRFDPKSRYEIDYEKGEISVYPASLDDVGPSV